MIPFVNSKEIKRFHHGSIDDERHVRCKPNHNKQIDLRSNQITRKLRLLKCLPYFFLNILKIILSEKRWRV